MQSGKLQDSKLQDFYGRFHVKIPKDLRTPGKIATAGMIGDFVHFVGRKVFEWTDTDIREMKRVVTHLLNTTKQIVDLTNNTLKEMRSARKLGNIDEYVEGIRLIGKEQSSFKREFSDVYNSYLKEPYEHAYKLDQEKRVKDEAEGRETPYEEVVFAADGQANVIEVDSPPLDETDPLQAAEDAEDSPKGSESEIPDTVKQTPVEIGDSPPTTRSPQTQPQNLGDPIAVIPESQPSASEPDIVEPDVAEPQPNDTLVEVGGEETPPSSDLKIDPKSDPKSKIIKEFPAGVPGYGNADDGHPVLSSVEIAMTKVAHTKFLSELGKIAEKENKYIVAAFMAKYSEELEDTNPQASAALLKAAQEISND